jgi:hypothetical protein
VLALVLPVPDKPDAALSGARSFADQALEGESVALQQEAFEPALDYRGLEHDRQKLSVRN